MKVEIIKDGEKIVKDLQVKGRYITQLIDRQVAITNNTDEDKQMLLIKEYNDLMDKIACESAGMTLKEFEDLYAEQQNKITDYLKKLVRNKFDFLGSSST